MPEKSSVSSEKSEKIVLDRVKDRLIDNVFRVEHAEQMGKVFKEKFNYFYENLVYKALDLGKKKGTCLDLGTPFGLCAINLAKQDYDFGIVSLQDSQKLVSLSRSFAEDDVIENKIEWTLGRPENIPFAENSFDMIVSNFDLHHWEDPARVFGEIERVLKGNGVLVIGEVRRDSFRVMIPALKVFSYAMKNEKIYDNMKFWFNSSYTRSEITKLLMDSPLKDSHSAKDMQFLYVMKCPKEKHRVIAKFS